MGQIALAVFASPPTKLENVRDLSSAAKVLHWAAVSCCVMYPLGEYPKEAAEGVQEEPHVLPQQ